MILAGMMRPHGLQKAGSDTLVGTCEGGSRGSHRSAPRGSGAPCWVGGHDDWLKTLESELPAGWSWVCLRCPDLMTRSTRSVCVPGCNGWKHPSTMNAGSSTCDERLSDTSWLWFEFLHRKPRGGGASGPNKPDLGNNACQCPEVAYLKRSAQKGVIGKKRTL